MKSKQKGLLSIWILLAVFCVLGCLVLALWRGASLRLPGYIGRELSEGERAEIIGRNSPLVDYVHLTANADFPRKDEVRKITIHHMAGNFSLESVGRQFAKPDRNASSNYGIDSDGRVALYVEECNRAWTSSSRENDHQAVTIEVANDQIGGDWHVSDAAYDALIELCVDICRRNGIGELIFTGDPDGNLTIHKMFSNKTECPGAYLESKMESIADAVNAELGGSKAE